MKWETVGTKTMASARCVSRSHSAFGYPEVALIVDSREKVDRVHKRALEFGGKNEGPAGPQGKGFYTGNFRYRDGNKLCVFCAG